MNREEIKNLLPHREPMLLLDEVTVTDNVAFGKYYVRGDEWFLQGHFPGNPVVPGVILCEIMAQTCCMLLGESAHGKTPFYTGIDGVRFRSPVRPGDTIETRLEIEKSKDNFFFTKGKATVDGKLCAQGKLSFALVEGR